VWGAGLCIPPPKRRIAHGENGAATGIKAHRSSVRQRLVTEGKETNVQNALPRDDDDRSLLPQKRELMARFIALDPDGAGGPARGYWTCWGVAPAH
jgi:hypothetical protein